MGDWVLSRVARYPPAPSCGAGPAVPLSPMVVAVHPSREALLGVLAGLVRREGRSYAPSLLSPSRDGHEYPSAKEDGGDGEGRYFLVRSHGKESEPSPKEGAPLSKGGGA
jgi:hypothetical protein